MMKEVKIGVYTRGNESYDFNFCTDLSVADKVKFVNSVTDLVVDENHYNIVIRDLIFDFYVIDIMTDIDTTEFKESLDFLSDVEQFLEETNIVEIIKTNTSQVLFNELNKAIDDSISYLTGIYTNPLSEAIASFLSTIEKKINDIDLDGMKEMASVFSGMVGDVTPESIVNAYITSDAHKKNLVEIEEVKKQRTEFAKDMDKAIGLVDGSKKSKSKK